MKKLWKLVLNRVVWVALAVILQLSFFLYVNFWATAIKGWNSAVYVLTVVVVLYIMFGENQKSSYKMVWVFLIALFPLFGIVLYLILGDKKFSKHKRKRLEEKIVKNVGETLESEEAKNALMCTDPLLSRQSMLITSLSRYGLWAHTQALYFSNGEDFLKDALLELKKAKRFIFLEYFIITPGKCWDSILEVLKEKVKEGVDVRVLYDDLGSAPSLPYLYDKKLQSFGIKAHPFNPIQIHINPRLNFRDHRKIMNIDGDVCYTGGLNLADEYMNNTITHGYWKDNAVKIVGDGVWNLTLMFLKNWAFVTGEMPEDFALYKPSVHPKSDGFVQPFADSPLDYKNVALSGYVELLNHAKKYVWITTPYLILDEEITTTLIRVALCGVDVRIITPYVPDKKLVHEVTRSTYEKLVEAGVKIYEYTPGFIHSKTFVSDDEVAFVGTANLDYRSLYLHFELSIAFYRSSVVECVKQDFLNAMGYSKLQSLEEIKKVSKIKKLERKFLQLFAPGL